MKFYCITSIISCILSLSSSKYALPSLYSKGMERPSGCNISSLGFSFSAIESLMSIIGGIKSSVIVDASL